MNSRRRFIQSTAALLGATSIANSAFSSTLLQGVKQSATNGSNTNSRKTIGVGIIGVGSRGAGLASVINDIDGMKVSAICDTLPFRLEEAKPYIKHDDYKIYSDYRRLLEDKSVDAVIIATPFSMHANMALDAISSNKPIYCEKTLSYGIAESEKLVKAVEDSGLIFQTGHQHRNSPLVQRVRRYVQDGYLGKVLKIESQWNRNADWRRPVPDPSLERQINWRMYREFSGGLAAELCSHQIDFVNWISGSHPTRVMGIGGIDYWKDGRETYDNVNFLTEYASGMKASYTSLTSNAKDNRKITILGSKGSIIMHAETAYIYSETLPESADMGVVDGVSGATMNAWQQDKGVAIEEDGKDSTAYALIAFREAIANNSQPISDVKSGATTAVVVQMALDAMDSGSTQVWTSSLG
uniref:Gfo/Idh/MocA family protein n=1 Tax=Ningiella ruwaisensis TaxID=2364274 RepID=UPI00109F6DBE|nr:Gfo/Idh/MocA family oxidoreductase [Ningiella ruwaisensis]